ncbi:MAG: ABC transporter permease [Deltaproteobacteria bacterium]|nr:ABC transporter permease [Deltaproteobacteria bacterium]
MRFAMLLRTELRRSWRRLLVVSMAVVASVSTLTVLGGLGLGVYSGVVEPLLPRLPLRLLKIEPRAVSIGPIAFDVASLGGGLDDRALERLRALKGVDAVYPIVAASFPMRAVGGEGFIGRRIQTDVFATGLSSELVHDDVSAGYTFDDVDAEGRVPVLVARRLLELYNTTVAPAIDKPRLSSEALIGFEFELVLGASVARAAQTGDPMVRHVARIVGLSDHANLVGITIPEKTLRRWNRWWAETRRGETQRAETRRAETRRAEASRAEASRAERPRASERDDDPLSGAFVRIEDEALVGEVSAAIERAGFRMDETPKLLGVAVNVGLIVSGLFLFVVIGLAVLTIAQAFFLLLRERRFDFAILRALGARRKDVRALVVSEAAVVGALGAVGGATLGVGLLLGLEAWFFAKLPRLPVQLDHVVSLSPGLLIGAVGFGFMASSLGAVVPAMMATREAPLDVLRGSSG